MNYLSKINFSCAEKELLLQDRALKCRETIKV